VTTFVAKAFPKKLDTCANGQFKTPGLLPAQTKAIHNSFEVKEMLNCFNIPCTRSYIQTILFKTKRKICVFLRSAIVVRTAALCFRPALQL